MDNHVAKGSGIALSSIGLLVGVASSGIGLGLAIVKEIVQAHGGRITAASQVGRGTRSTVTLPGQSRSEAGKAL